VVDDKWGEGEKFISSRRKLQVEKGIYVKMRRETPVKKGEKPERKRQPLQDYSEQPSSVKPWTEPYSKSHPRTRVTGKKNEEKNARTKREETMKKRKPL